MKRQLVIERGLTLAVAYGREDAARELTAFCEARIEAAPYPTMIVSDEVRSFDREVAEELADARNYLVWGMQRDGATPRRLAALALVVRAWEALGYTPAETAPDALPEWIEETLRNGIGGSE